MPDTQYERVSPTSLALVQPLLTALDATSTAIPKPASSLPIPCFWIASIQTLVCATPINALPIFRAAMISAAALHKADVVLVKHGFWPETLDDVTIDVVMGRTRHVQMLWSLGRYLDGEGRTWLVPPADGAGPSVRLDAHGLTISPTPPYADLDERIDGLSRAARQTVRALRALRRT